eukprot:2582909-Rhodomonas_salina.3
MPGTDLQCTVLSGGRGSGVGWYGSLSPYAMSWPSVLSAYALATLCVVPSRGCCHAVYCTGGVLYWPRVWYYPVPPGTDGGTDGGTDEGTDGGTDGGTYGAGV